MNPPTNELRESVSRRVVEIRAMPDAEVDTILDEVIAQINGELQRELDQNPLSGDHANAQELAAACDAWASLVSHALVQAYAPMSPFPRNVAGWGQRAIQRVQQFSATLRGPLAVAQQGLNASSYSISVGFPWGISIGFTWP